MPVPAFDPHRMLSWAPVLGEPMRAALRWGSQHTGLPIILVAAIALVVSWRAFKRSLRFVIEVVIAVAALVFATRFGWITW
jgi:hypothetical protein